MKPTAYKNFFINQDGTKRVSYMSSPIIHDSIDMVLPLYAIPKGYKLVPIEPTTEMVNKGDYILWDQNNPNLRRIYKAMIEAAPDIEDI